jgi:hypothetical protein
MSKESEHLYIELAEKFKAIGLLFAKLAEQTDKPAADDKPAEEQTEPKKRGRPAKSDKPAEPPADAPPVEDDKTVTPDHPKRAELLTLAKALAAATDRDTAVKAVKLFGESTAKVPDAELDGAVAHLKGLIAKKKQTVEDDSI